MHEFPARHKFEERTRQSPASTTMAFQNLTVEVADRIATLTINRPDKLNALNDATIAEIGHAFDEMRLDESVAGIIVTGAGRAFVAGADISELASQTPVLAKGRSRA